MLTQLLRTRPALGFALALLISAFVTLVGVGGAVAGADDSPGTAVFLGFVGAVGVLMLVSFGLVMVIKEACQLRHESVKNLTLVERVPKDPLIHIGPSGERSGKVRLADASQAGDNRQAIALQLLSELSELVLAADKIAQLWRSFWFRRRWDISWVKIVDNSIIVTDHHPIYDRSAVNKDTLPLVDVACGVVAPSGEDYAADADSIMAIVGCNR